jgi:pyruvate formate lyase activating enzyme
LISFDDDGKAVIPADRCQGCSHACAEACPSQALTIYGKEMKVDDVLARVEQDALFYRRSGGGLTLSGGEPLMQPDFALALLREARCRRIRSALQTCGLCRYDALAEAARLVDVLMFDIKCIDADRHLAQTGTTNASILSTFTKLRNEFKELKVLVRTPVIPGFNDSREDIEAIMDFAEVGGAVDYELLPYHRMAQPKYEYLGRSYPMGAAELADTTMSELADFAEHHASLKAAPTAAIGEASLPVVGGDGLAVDVQAQ